MARPYKKQQQKDRTTKHKPVLVQPPIPLERPEKKELSKTDYLVVKLRSVPDDAESETYEVNVPYFSHGKTEEWLKTLKDISRALKGQNITDGPGKYRFARRILDGDALAAFNAAATELGNETNDHYNQAMQKVTEHVLPKRALSRQRRFMRRQLRKPFKMAMQTFVARVNEINKYLDSFPPFHDDQKLSEEDLLELLEFGLPKSWQNQMTLQGFVPSDKTMAEFLEFCDRLEMTEEGGTERTERASKSDKSHDESHKKRQNRKRSHDREESEKGEFYCELHGKNSTHSTGECRVLKAQAKKMRAAYESQTPAQKRKFKQQQELNALVTEAVEQAMKKKVRFEDEVPKRTAKRKLDEPDFDHFNNAMSDSDEMDI